MRLQSLTLENFRQFYGVQSLDFSGDDDANVTIIHGENGSGKTALLNAFKWTFYGTTDFATGSDKLMSERCIVEAGEGDELKLSVSIKFDHDDRHYEATRNQYFKKLEGMRCKKVGDSQIELSWTDEDGTYNKSNNPSTHINQILPSRMHPYFFFNGERIEKLSSVESSPEIQQAIKGMMGIEIIERASRHLGQYVIKDLKKDLKNLSTDELKDVIDNETSFTEMVQDASERIDQIKSNSRGHRALLGDINNKLKSIGPVSELQKERERLGADLEDIVNKINSVHKERLQHISRYGFLSVSEKMINEAKSILDDRRKKGELPAKIKMQFLSDLLSQERCLCDRALEPGTDAYQCVQNFKKSSVSNDVENAFIKTSGDLAAMQVSRPKLFDQLNSFRERVKEYETARSHKHGRIDEISRQIGESELEDVEKLENKREEIRGELSKIDQSLGEWSNKLRDAERSLADWSKKRKELDKIGDKAGIANEKLELAEEMERVISQLHNSLSEAVRVELSSIVNETFRSIMKKDYWAEIDSDYSLQIKKRIGDHIQNVADKSTGESQVSSLSFIGGLVSLAKKRHAQAGAYYKGGLYPIVMDSPYGNLDPEYRSKVASYIPDLAEQVIIMVSNSQWKGDVESSVRRKMGKEYTLIYHTPNKKEDTKTASVIGGVKYEYTEIREGYYE